MTMNATRRMGCLVMALSILMNSALSIAQQRGDRSAPVSVYLYKSQSGFPGELLETGNQHLPGRLNSTMELAKGRYLVGVSAEGVGSDEVRQGVNQSVTRQWTVWEEFKPDLVVRAVGSPSRNRPILLPGPVSSGSPNSNFLPAYQVDRVVDTVVEKISMTVDADVGIDSIRWIAPDEFNQQLPRSVGLETP